MEKTRYLLLENGTVFKGKAFGAEGDALPVKLSSRQL